MIATFLRDETNSKHLVVANFHPVIMFFLIKQDSKWSLKENELADMQHYLRQTKTGIGDMHYYRMCVLFGKVLLKQVTIKTEKDIKDEHRYISVHTCQTVDRHFPFLTLNPANRQISSEIHAPYWLKVSAI